MMSQDVGRNSDGTVSAGNGSFIFHLGQFELLIVTPQGVPISEFQQVGKARISVSVGVVLDHSHGSCPFRVHFATVFLELD